MLDTLSGGFKKAKEKLSGHTTLNEDNISSALDLVRSSLLDADVEYGVARNFLARVKEKALGEKVQLRSGKGKQQMQVTASDHFVQVCHDELVNLMGPVDASLNFPRHQPAIIMMVGLQGTGKTTTTGKLARFLRTARKRKPLLVAADIYRPAARQQLQVLGQRIDTPVFTQTNDDAVAICQAALTEAAKLNCDTLLIDTAGRLTIDAELMAELQNIKQTINPSDILLVCDAMMGQDAVTTARSFHDSLDLSGIIMTKLDGDARGGAALSIKEVTGVPIKFLGMGESLEKLEKFRPPGLASRILGLGDVVGLMQDFERVVDDDREEEALRMMQGKFNLKDFYEQASTLQKIGSMQDLVDKLPIQNMIPQGAKVDEHILTRARVMISSMTEKERLLPDIINHSRTKRIADGSGRSIADVNNMMQQFRRMRQMMGSLGKNMGLASKIPGVAQLAKMKEMKDMANDPDKMQAFMQQTATQTANPHPNTQPRAPKAPKIIDPNKLKKMRQAAKNARRKNRRK